MTVWHIIMASLIHCLVLNSLPAQTKIYCPAARWETVGRPSWTGVSCASGARRCHSCQTARKWSRRAEAQQSSAPRTAWASWRKSHCLSSRASLLHAEEPNGEFRQPHILLGHSVHWTLDRWRANQRAVIANIIIHGETSGWQRWKSHWPRGAELRYTSRPGSCY